MVALSLGDTVVVGTAANTCGCVGTYTIRSILATGVIEVEEKVTVAEVRFYCFLLCTCTHLYYTFYHKKAPMPTGRFSCQRVFALD